jgi:hypothetical protein
MKSGVAVSQPSTGKYANQLILPSQLLKKREAIEDRDLRYRSYLYPPNPEHILERKKYSEAQSSDISSDTS